MSSESSTHITDEVDAEHELDLYRRMQLIRRFEERVYLVYLQGELPGTLHQSQGQEAVAVGVCDVLRPTDWITSTHRPHGHALAKGVDVRAAMAELYGKATGCCGGKGGSMHLGDPSVGMLPAIAIVGGGNTVVTGLGLAFKLMRTDQVAVCFFGEGASNEGAFHEGLNFAAVQHLPIVFACENNLYGASTPFHQISLVTDVAARATAYGVRGVDRRRHGRARRARGGFRVRWRTHVWEPAPSFSSSRHTDSPATAAVMSAAIGAARRRPNGRREIRSFVCVIVSRRRLVKRSSMKRMRRCEATLDDAIEFARNSPLPRAEDALTDAYATVIGREATP